MRRAPTSGLTVTGGFLHRRMGLRRSRPWLSLAGCVLLGSTPLLATAADTASPVAVAPDMAGAAVRTVLSLLAVVVLILSAGWLMRRVQAGDGLNRRAVRVLEGVSVGARERVVLVEVGTTQLLLGVAPGQVRTLHVLEQRIERAEPAAPPRFADVLQRLRRSAGAAP